MFALLCSYLIGENMVIYLKQQKQQRCTANAVEIKLLITVLLSTR